MISGSVGKSGARKNLLSAAVDGLFEQVRQSVADNRTEVDIGRQVVDYICEYDQVSSDVGLHLWKIVLEDRQSRHTGLTSAVWTYIREMGGALKTSFGVLVGKSDLMMDVLSRDDLYSVQGVGGEEGYLSRMKQSIGPIYLGLDRTLEPGQSNADADAINAEIGKITRLDAFETTVSVTRKAISELKPDGPSRFNIPVVWLVDEVLARLCQHWFDVPDGHLIKVGGQPSSSQKQELNCPYHYAMPSRYFFSPHPNGYEVKAGQLAGAFLQKATKGYFLGLAKAGQKPKGTLSRFIVEHFADDPDKMASTLVGVMMGFLPTVTGNMLEMFNRWMDHYDPLQRSAFWDLHQQYRETKHSDSQSRLDFLAPYLESALQHNPVPEMIWRVAKESRFQSGSGLGCPVKRGDKVVLGVMSAMHDSGSVYPVFGGYRNRDNAVADSREPVHACPGYEMAMGVMLGMVAGVLEAGSGFDGIWNLYPSNIPKVFELRKDA